MIIWLCHNCILLELRLHVLKGGHRIYSGCHLPNPVSHTWQVLNNFCVELHCTRYPENVLFELLFQLEEAPSFWSVVYICRVVAPGLRAKPICSHWDQSRGHWPCAVTSCSVRKGPVKDANASSHWWCSFEMLSWCEMCPLLFSLLLWPFLWSFFSSPV